MSLHQGSTSKSHFTKIGIYFIRPNQFVLFAEKKTDPVRSIIATMKNVWVKVKQHRFGSLQLYWKPRAIKKTSRWRWQSRMRPCDLRVEISRELKQNHMHERERRGACHSLFAIWSPSPLPWLQWSYSEEKMVPIKDQIRDISCTERCGLTFRPLYQ